ncbi:hypothetical protein V6N13_033771 [Hibiscus sabdariffa]
MLASILGPPSTKLAESIKHVEQHWLLLMFCGMGGTIAPPAGAGLRLYMGPRGFALVMHQKETKLDDKGDVSTETTGPAQADILAGFQISAERLAVLSAYP